MSTASSSTIRWISASASASVRPELATNQRRLTGRLLITDSVR
jgi:hypothetical protein